jgi:uncharacterized protein (DUF1778 family)
MKLPSDTEALFDGPRTAPFSIRFPLEAKRRIEEAARRECKTVTNFILAAALERVAAVERDR